MPYSNIRFEFKYEGIWQIGYVVEGNQRREVGRMLKGVFTENEDLRKRFITLCQDSIAHVLKVEIDWAPHVEVHK